MMVQLFEYAIFKDEKLDKDGDVVEKASIVVPPTTILARDERQAQIVISKALPDEHMDDLDRIQVVMRPFG